MSKPIVAIVGRTNVGKSTLFNKLVGERRSIVDDSPNVTRDRIIGDCEWNGRSFTLVDTGGLDPSEKGGIGKRIADQVETAVSEADVIIFVTDIRSGVHPVDAEMAVMLKKSRKPVVLCVNKCDSTGETPAEFYEFYNLDMGDPVEVSAVHGTGTGDLLDRVTSYFPEDEEPAGDDDRIKVAVIGRPNTGKSTLINTILGEERMIVSDVAGTTRDAVDTEVDNSYGKYLFIDTAGIRRRSKIDSRVEQYSAVRTVDSVDRADVCVIMVDGTEGFAEQDSKIAGLAHNRGKASIIAVNKWDLVPKTSKTENELRKKYMNDFSFMSYAPVIFISAKEKIRIPRLFELINFVDEQNSMRISTGTLNDLLARAVERVEPPSDKGRKLKIYYITQPSTRPPTFVCFVNDAELFHFSYKRYLENQIRSAFGLEGTPVRIIVRERG
ncbi:MAG: ribosome biogenesis GTPase Der [Oscillospiraceae bacterium]|jgi:GTP-binding protein